jgi:hypothetical protein
MLSTLLTPILPVSIRQAARALQGKTGTHNASLIFNDPEHNSGSYVEYLEKAASNPKRPKTVYMSIQLPILVLYGFHREAIALGEMLLPMIDSLWCQRMTYAVMYYLSLAYLSVLTEESEHPDKERMLDYASQTIKRLEVRTHKGHHFCPIRNLHTHSFSFTQTLLLFD